MPIKLTLSLAIASLAFTLNGFAGVYLDCAAEDGATFDGGKETIRVYSSYQDHLIPKGNKKGDVKMQCSCHQVGDAEGRFFIIKPRSDSSSQHTVCGKQGLTRCTLHLKPGKNANIHWRVNRDNHTVPLWIGKTHI
jgi:hypothetical protein